MSKERKKQTIKKSEMAGNAIYFIVKIVVVIVAVMFVYRLGTMAYAYGERLFGEPPMTTAPGNEVSFTIEASDDVRTVGEKLQDAGLIRDAALFQIQERLLGTKNGLQPGTYTLNTAQTPEEMIQLMSTVRAGEGETEQEDD